MFSCLYKNPAILVCLENLNMGKRCLQPGLGSSKAWLKDLVSGASVQFFLVLDLQSKTWDGVTLFSLRQVVSWLGNVVPECDEHPKPGIASRSRPDPKIS